MKQAATKTAYAILTVILTIAANGINAQEREIQVFVSDSADKTPVENCGLSFMKPGDSASRKFFFSDKKGAVVFKTNLDTVFIATHHQGYLPFSKTLDAKTSVLYISLLPAVKELEDVVVKSYHSPDPCTQRHYRI